LSRNSAQTLLTLSPQKTTKTVQARDMLAFKLGRFGWSKKNPGQFV
jgi:hypothetical protein